LRRRIPPPGLSADARTAIEATQGAINSWGGAIGEALGVAGFAAIWAISASLLILRDRQLPAWAGLAGLAAGADFGLDLTFTPTQPPLLQGQAGFSRKGPGAGQASYYYSLPQMAVSGTVTRDGKARKVTGRAWLDREWSSTLLDPKAVGWDWAGINLPDGAALTAFQVRDAAGNPVWAGGSWRRADGRLTTLGPGDVTFQALRRWRSPRTKALYPVEQAITVRLPEGERTLTLKPLFDDQELDSRAGGGPVYWEGAVSDGAARGYLELTGYFEKLSL
jgi:predicted secreted hydrolase